MCDCLGWATGRHIAGERRPCTAGNPSAAPASMRTWRCVSVSILTVVWSQVLCHLLDGGYHPMRWPSLKVCSILFLCCVGSGWEWSSQNALCQRGQCPVHPLEMMWAWVSHMTTFWWLPRAGAGGPNGCGTHTRFQCWGTGVLQNDSRRSRPRVRFLSGAYCSQQNTCSSHICLRITPNQNNPSIQLKNSLRQVICIYYYHQVIGCHDKFTGLNLSFGLPLSIKC